MPTKVYIRMCILYIILLCATAVNIWALQQRMVTRLRLGLYHVQGVPGKQESIK